MNKTYKRVRNAKLIVTGILDRSNSVEDALRNISTYAWSIRHSNYALFRAIMAVYYAVNLTEDYRLGMYIMPTTADVIDWMRKHSRKYARQDERYRKERGI